MGPPIGKRRDELMYSDTPAGKFDDQNSKCVFFFRFPMMKRVAGWSSLVEMYPHDFSEVQLVPGMKNRH